MRRLGGTSLAVLLALLLAGCGGSDPSGAPPNIVFVLADDLGFGDLGSYGSTRNRTPNLDRLASDGMRLTQFYADGATCTPTRSAILTGRYPHRLGLRWELIPDSKRGIPARFATLPEILARRGYETTLIGKWHVGANRRSIEPLGRGFQHFFGFLDIQKLGPGLYSGPRLQTDAGPPIPYEGDLTDLLVDRAVETIRTERQGPLFLAIWLFAPHVPIQPPERWQSRYPATPEGRYAALVSHLDEGVGRILTALEERGLRDDTLFVFTSDNGGNAKGPGSNGALRGWKGQFFEGGIRVPFLAAWPGRIEPGTGSDAVAVTRDLFPTFLEAAGADPGRIESDAESFLSILLGRAATKAADRTLFWERSVDSFAVRRGPWKLVGNAGASFLFDLGLDPGEQNDQRVQHPERVAELLAGYRAWRAEMGRIEVTVARAEGDAQPAGRLWTFPGAGGRVVLADDEKLDPDDGDFSLCLWVLPEGDSVARGASLASKGEAWGLEIEPGGRVLFRARGRARGRAATLELRTAGTLEPGRWTHVAVTLTGGNVLKAALHLDGQESARSAGVHPEVDERPVVIGAGGDAAQPFRGRISDLRFWSLELADDEIEELVRGGPPQPE